MIKGSFKKTISISLSAILLCILTACSGNNGAKASLNNAASNASKFTIVTSFYPMYISTLNIVKDIEGVQVVNMTEPITGCLHDYTLTTKDVKTLENADAFVVNGADMESFMEDVTSQIKDLKIITASEGIELIKGDGEEGDNPHVWVSIEHAITQVKNIEKQLSAIDPDRSEAYKKNADAYVKKLEEERQKMHSVLDNVTQKDIVTFHEAFPYFAREFNLNIVGVVEREPGSEPSAKELADTIKQVKDLGIKALFAEPQYPAKAAETIAADTGAKVYTLDPAVTGPMEADAYIQIMDKNLEVLKEALK